MKLRLGHTGTIYAIFIDFKEYIGEYLWFCLDKGSIFDDKLSEGYFLPLVVSVILEESLQHILIQRWLTGLR